MTGKVNESPDGEPLLGLGLGEGLGQMVAKLRERGNAMRCHPAANGTISHTEAGGELLCEVASLIEKLAAERDSFRADAERFRWLAERTAAAGLERWVHPFQFLCEAVDERRKAGATMCD